MRVERALRVAEADNTQRRPVGIDGPVAGAGKAGDGGVAGREQGARVVGGSRRRDKERDKCEQRRDQPPHLFPPCADCVSLTKF